MLKRGSEITHVGTEKILVSACLLGKKCSYDGRGREVKEVKDLSNSFELIDVCPEVLGGLPIPRPHSEIRGGDGKDVLEGKAKVLNERGEDVTEYFIKGAQTVLKIVKKNKIKFAIMKARSPSCGSKWIYDGSFSSTLKKGDGVTTALLKENGVSVYTEEEIEEFLKEGGKEWR